MAAWGIDNGVGQYASDNNNIKWLVRPPHDNVHAYSRYPTIFDGPRIGGSSGPFWFGGTGVPEGDAPVGSLYSRTDGGPTDSAHYVKTAAGAGKANWTLK